MLCGQNDYVIRRTYRRAQPVVGVVRIDQTLHIILCTFLWAPRCASDAATQNRHFDVLTLQGSAHRRSRARRAPLAYLPSIIRRPEARPLRRERHKKCFSLIGL